MSLWNIIRNFFVQYIFGGYYWSVDGNFGYWTKSNGFFVVPIIDASNPNSRTGFTSTADFEIFNGMSLGDWLSTTFTIITLIAICVFFFFVVRWLFRLTSGLIQGRG